MPYLRYKNSPCWCSHCGTQLNFKMKFYSTNKQAPLVDFREATILGQAPDKGLYFPEYIPAVPPSMCTNPGAYPKAEIAFEIMYPYTKEVISKSELQDIVQQTVDFKFPLVPVNEQVFSLELFHGPTMAFKDVGARFMSRCLAKFGQYIDSRIIVLVATSGDTGGAVAAGFANVPGIDVVILYPSKKVSEIQELQLLTGGENIRALEVIGNFDDCQRLVKQAFADKDLCQQVTISSANSINVARWLPQQFYYFFALQQWPIIEMPPVISVPSGNFGNICAGLLAKKSGLAVSHFIAACNSNDVIPRFLVDGNYSAQVAKATLSNAMDVGDPSNFVRILELYQHNLNALKKDMSSFSFDDHLTASCLKTIYSQYAYLPDPHGTIGFLGLQKYLQQHPEEKGIFLETAHPVKFKQVMEQLIDQDIEIPEQVQNLFKLPQRKTRIAPEYDILKSLLLEMR